MEKNLQRFALWAAGDLTGNRMRNVSAATGADRSVR